MKTIIDVRLNEPTAERVRQSIVAAVKELQDLPASSIRVFKNVVLPDNTEVRIAHRLGRAPNMVKVSPIRAIAGTTAGAIFEYRGTGTLSGTPIDSTQVIVLAAFGFTNTVTVDLEVT